MNVTLFIIAHSPLASALRSCVAHVFPDRAGAILILDVAPDSSPEHTLSEARYLLQQADLSSTLVLTDVFGATPCNVAQKLSEAENIKVVAGVNLPMLLRAVSYCHESLDALVSRAMSGGTQGVLTVAVAAPQEQTRQKHDQNHRDHQQ
jgi:mannose PTS system EIIA component